MQEDGKTKGLKTSIAEAQKLAQTALIWWRPEPKLPEPLQYALVYEV